MKRKRRKSRATPPKNRKTKKRIQKRKQRRTKTHSGRNKKISKTKKISPRKPPRTRVKETRESSYWKRGLRRKTRQTRSRFTTKSFLGRDGAMRTIRKKQYSSKSQTLNQIVNANSRFATDQTIFARIAYRSKEGKIKWASAPRQFIRDRDDLEGVISLLMLYADEYAERTGAIEGFDIEKTLEES